MIDVVVLVKKMKIVVVEVDDVGGWGNSNVVSFQTSQGRKPKLYQFLNIVLNK